MLICNVTEGKPGISCVYLNNSSNAISVIYEVSIHKVFETNQVFCVTWENALSFTLFPAVKQGKNYLQLQRSASVLILQH